MTGKGKIRCYKAGGKHGYVKDTVNGFDLPFNKSHLMEGYIPVGCGVLFETERIDGKLYAVNIRRNRLDDQSNVR